MNTKSDGDAAGSNWHEFNTTETIRCDAPVEKCSEAAGVTWDQLRAVSAVFSYLFCIQTGEDGSNFPEVTRVWDSL